MRDKKIQDYVTIGRTFENYKWYKPLLTLIVTAVIYIILNTILTGIFAGIYGEAFITNMSANYDAMNAADAANVYGFLVIALFVPSIYLASRIVKDRPFSSYASSRGGWDWKLYIKCMIIPLAVYAAANIIATAIEGPVNAPNTLNAIVFVVFLVLICAQSISEEFLFRGIIMQTLGSWINIPIAAIIIQGVFFAAFHPYNITGVITTVLGGIMFGIVAWKTNGLEAGSAIHSLNNIFAFMLAFAGIQQVATNASIIDAASNLIAQLISIVLLIYIGRKYGWFDKVSQ